MSYNEAIVKEYRMFKIIRQHSSKFKKGELVRDHEFLLDLKRITAEDGMMPVYRYMPDWKWSATNRQAGTFIKSRVKHTHPRGALKAAISRLADEEISGTMFNHDGYHIVITADDEPYIEVDIRYKWRK